MKKLLNSDWLRAARKWYRSAKKWIGYQKECQCQEKNIRGG